MSEVLIAATTSQEAAAVEASQGRIVTVFHDAAAYNAKHALERAWTLWYDNPQKKSNYSNWLANLKRISTIDTVEDFWGLYNNVLKASTIPMGANYHFFLKGVQPMWEDPANAQGGKWTLTIPKNKKDNIDAFWLNALLSIIGECYGEEGNDEVSGVVFSPRQKQDRISLWTKHTTPAARIEAVGRAFKTLLGVDADCRITFQQHEDYTAKGSSGASSGGAHHGASAARDSKDMYVV